MVAKKPVETTVTNNYAETTSTEVKLRLKHAVFVVNYALKRRNFFLSATVPAVTEFVFITAVLNSLLL